MGSFNGDRGFSGGRNFVKRDFGGRSGDRQMFKAICSNCGKPCEVPFHPTNGKPVYCSDCFGKMKNSRPEYSRPDAPRPERPEFRAPSFDPNKNLLESINIKLDKILRLLEPKIATATVPAEAAKVSEVSPTIEEVKTPKVKKTKKPTSIK